MTESSLLEAAVAYLASLRQRLASVDYRDDRGEPIGALRPSEEAALVGFLAAWGAQREAKNLELVVDLEPDARKHVVAFFGILPLLEATLREDMKGVLYLAPDANAEAGAHLSYRAMMILNPPVHFDTWEAVVPRFENGYREVPLVGLWVIGDLDWSGAPIGPPVVEKRLEGLGRVRRSPACRKVLLHQAGQATLVPYPLKPLKGSTCFIATAACGSPEAWEVETLRVFRERALRPRRAGRLAIAAYERLSPPLARWIEHRPRVRAWVRRVLIRPLARALS